MKLKQATLLPLIGSCAMLLIKILYMVDLIQNDLIYLDKFFAIYSAGEIFLYLTLIIFFSVLYKNQKK